MPDKCPACQNYIFSTRGIRGSQGTDENGDPYPFWTDDPLKTPLGLSGSDWKGRDGTNYVYLQELRDYYNDLETEIGLSQTSWSEPLNKGNPFRRVYIEELRIAIERILTSVGKTIEDYFRYDRHGDDTGSSQTDWTDVDRTSGYPLLPTGINPARAIYLEELRRGIFVFAPWSETWSTHIIARQATPPSSPSLHDRYIVTTGTGDWSSHDDQIAEWNGSEWVFTSPSDQFGVYVKTENKFYVYDTGVPEWAVKSHDEYIELLSFVWPSVGTGVNVGSRLYADHNWWSSSLIPGFNGAIRLWAYAGPPPSHPNWYSKLWIKRDIISDETYQFYSKADVSVHTVGNLAWAEAIAGYISGMGDTIIYHYPTVGTQQIEIIPGIKFKTTGSITSSITTSGSPSITMNWLYTVLRVDFTAQSTGFSYNMHYVYKHTGTNDPYNINAAAVFTNWGSMTRDFYADADSVLALYGKTITDDTYKIKVITMRYTNWMSIRGTGGKLSELDVQMDKIEFYKDT